MKKSIYLQNEKLYHAARGGYSMKIPKFKLNAARVNTGMTQTEVAKALNKNKQTIVNWENGATAIKVRDLLQLSKLYGIPIEYLEVPEKKK